MLAYLDPEYLGRELLWLAAVIIIVGAGVWRYRKNWIVASIVGLIVIFWAMAIIPDSIPARDSVMRLACQSNLRIIQEAKNHWAAEHHKQKTDVPTDSDLFGEGRYLKTKPECPAGGTFILGRIDEAPKCSLAESKGHKLD